MGVAELVASSEVGLAVAGSLRIPVAEVFFFPDVERLVETVAAFFMDCDR